MIYRILVTLYYTLQFMKQFLFIVLTICLPSIQVLAQCPENSEDKVLLVGDSWAFFMGVDGTINNVFEDWGFPEYKFYTNLTLAENGAETVDFFKPSKQNEISSKLLSKPSIKFVHLSIGGNDVLGSWKSQSFTEQQVDEMILATEDSLNQVIDFIKSVRPDITIVWSGYAYPNFEEVIKSFLIPSQHPFYSTWDKMEKPSFQEINELLNRFSDDVEAMYANDPRVFYVKAPGITQYTYGQTSALGVPPSGTYPAYTAPLPYGYVNYPSPKNSMRNYGITKDCFHLSQQGFKDLVGYTTQKFYHKALMDDTYIIASDNQTNGSVSSDGTVSSQLLLGEEGGINYKTLLTFETMNQLTYNVEKASIFLHRIQQTGGNPVEESIEIEVKNGAFGASFAVEPVDYTATGTQSGTPCLHGSNTDGNWVRLDLPIELLPFITNNENTQFKIISGITASAKVEFSNVDDPDFAPVLNITYGTTPTLSIAEDFISPELIIYPNPTSTTLHVALKYADFIQANLYSLDGKQVMESIESNMNVMGISPGTYILRVNTSKGVLYQKVVIEN